MIRVVGVRFKKAGKVYYFDPGDYPITAGAKVVVETARGVEYGEVAVGPKDVAEDQVVQPLKKVLRIGNDKDAVVAAENKRKENEAFGIAQKKIEAHTLEMNLVDVEYTFDGSKIIFYFTAEGRIDFRELVRDLASVFRTRIEMRQIGVRDEAKLLGGIGPCGRILCCTSFLGDFAPVSIRMAKDQNLSLNPSKISGLCGRLMCCLRYEQDTYEAAKKDPTLAPGYVPPVLLEESAPNLDELEDRPAPAIGIRRPNRESGMSARIAQAAGVAERPARREERQPEARRERPQGGERVQGGDRPPQGRPQQNQGGQPQGERRGERPQQGRPPQQQGKGRPQGQQQAQGGGDRPQRPLDRLPGERLHGERVQGERIQGERPQQGRPPQQQGKGRPQGQQQAQGQGGGDRPQRQHGGDRAQQGDRPQQGRGQQPQQQRQQSRPQGERQPQGERDRQGGAPEGAEGGNKEQQNRSRHHRHRRRGGGGGAGQGGQNPQGGGNPPA